MKVKSTIFKRKGKPKLDEKTGKLIPARRSGKWVLQITFDDAATGKRRTREKQFDRRIDAVDARVELVGQIEQTEGRIATGAKMSFRDLCGFSKANFYKPAVIAEGRKIDGVRSWQSVWRFLEKLSEYFGQRRIGEIDRSDLRAYRLWRLNHSPGPVSLTTVNRELSAMRRIMKYAFHEGWIMRDIFAGAKVIDSDAEKARTRLLTLDEEALLLAACEGRREMTYTRTLRGKVSAVASHSDVYNEYLKAVILLALDSAMRRGEILKLRWEDVDLDNNMIVIVGTHTKTEKERLAPLTDRTAAELRKLPTYGVPGRIFPFSDFKRSWTTAKRIAGIDDLRFHDLRRTAITKFNMKGIPLATAGKIAGHARLETTMKHYIGSDEAIVREVARILNDAPPIEAADGDFVN